MPPQPQQEQPQYQDYLPMICKAVWARVRQNPWEDPDELMAQGRLAFAVALDTWDPAKGI